MSINFWFLFSSVSSVPFSPASSALKMTTGLAQSIRVIGSFPYPGTSKISCLLPVGNSLPVRPPPGFSKVSSMGEPVPGTPWILVSPSMELFPFFTKTRLFIILFVLVLKMRTIVSGSFASTIPSSMAYGPTAEDIFPQFPLLST